MTQSITGRMRLTKPEHEFECPRCHGLIVCTCGNPFAHKRDEPFPYAENSWCAGCRADYHDESGDPDDARDQRAYDSEIHHCGLTGNLTDPRTDGRYRR